MIFHQFLNIHPMNVPETIENLLGQIHKAQESQVIQQTVYTSSNPFHAKHEFLFFIKPEITLKDERIRTGMILKMMFLKLDDFHFDIRDIRILGAPYLDRFNIMARHYGVINAMSRKPIEFITPEGSEKFRSVFGKSMQEANVLGGLEFLENYPDFNPVSLDELWQGAKAVKLAGGTYCAPVTIHGQQVLLINGFHPRQLIHFTEKGRSIIAFTLAGDIDWVVARNNFIGKTNPEDALPGSLRHELLKRREEFGLESVNASRNGFHLSAGPVEGLVELMRYGSDFSLGIVKKTDDFLFGRELYNHFSDDQISRICENHFVSHNGTRISVFDLTEEKNSEQAIKLLIESKF